MASGGEKQVYIDTTSYTKNENQLIVIKIPN